MTLFSDCWSIIIRSTEKPLGAHSLNSGLLGKLLLICIVFSFLLLMLVKASNSPVLSVRKKFTVHLFFRFHLHKMYLLWHGYSKRVKFRLAFAETEVHCKKCTELQKCRWRLYVLIVFVRSSVLRMHSLPALLILMKLPVTYLEWTGVVY